MRRWLRSLVVGAVIGLVGVAFALTPWFPPFEMRVGLFSLFHLRGTLAPPPAVAVVAIDNRTGQKLGLRELPRDWPRSIHAKLVDELVRRGAAVIVFDMDFRQPKNADDDRELGDAIRRANRVVLFAHLNGRRQPIEDAAGRQRGAVWVENLESPLPVFAEVALALAPFPLPKLDAAVDQFWTFKSSARDVSTMPVAALQVYALPALAEWGELLTAAGADLSPVVANEFGAMRASRTQNSEMLSQLMLDIRRRFERDPMLAARVAKKIAERAVLSPHAQLHTALLGLYAGTNTRYLNFYGPPGTIATVPYHAVIQGSDPNIAASALDFSGKVVFVGYSDLFDPGQPDRFYTVFTRSDGVDLSGVEIAATAFGNLLRDESLRPVDAGETALLLLLFGIGLGALIYSAPAAIGVSIGILATVLYALGAQLAFNRAHIWLPLATPVLLQFPLALFIGLFGQYRLEQQRANNISDAIRLYVPEEVSRTLTARAVKPDSVNRVTYSTCLATDMAGFSTIAEAMKPGELAIFLNEYFEVLAQALRQHGVNVTEFRADAIMCAWTGAVEDVAVRRLPVLAALEANRAIARFNVQRGLSGSLRVGMADGEVFVGHAGGGGHFVYSIVGDCANTASRIEGLNKHLNTQLLATGTVVRELAEFLIRPLGNFRFVGKTEALPIAEIIGLREGANASDLERCEQFAQALAVFEQGRWSEAATQLENFLLQNSQDGPAKFLHGRCRAYLADGDTPEDPAVIVMSAK